MINRITNYELRITNKKRFFLSLFIILYSLFFIHGFASAWVIGDPLVPCGPNYTNSQGQLVIRQACTQCELLHLVDNLMDFILIAAAPILATFFFIVAGLYIMLGGARPDMLATGKRMFTSALVGILIVMLAWLITNTLITSLIAPNLSQNLPSGGVYNFDSTNWFNLACDTLGLKKTTGVICNGQVPICNPPCSGGLTCVPNANCTQSSCQSVSPPPGYVCDPMTNAGCPAGQTCYLDPFTSQTLCQ